MKRLGAVALLFFLVVPAVHAQQLSDQITVNVVEVPVNVTRYTGEPVRGLTKEDFELFVNGQPQPIQYFDMIEPAQQPSEAGERPDLHRRRLFVLLFDDLSSSMISIHRAKIAAQKFVESAPAGDVFAVAVTTRRGIQFAVPFTTDRVALLRAITTLRTSAAGDAFNLATLEAERTQWSERIVNEWDPPGVQASFSFETKELFEPRSQARVGADEWLLVQHERAMQQIGDLADRLAPISGIKHVVLLREGTAMQPDIAKSYYFDLMRAHRKFRDAGVILDAVDIAGLQAPWDSGDTGLLRDPRYSLWELTLETGGTVAPTLDSLRRTQSVTYILGFRPPAPGKNWNAVDVRLRNKPFGAIVQHRRGYSNAPAADDTNESLFLADVLLNDIPLRGVSVDLDVQRQDHEATVVAEVPGIEILSLGANGTTTMDVYLYVLDENDVVASWTQLRLNVDHAKGRDFLAENPYTIRQKFKLGPGRYSAKALVQVVGSGAKGFQRASFEIPRS